LQTRSARTSGAFAFASEGVDPAEPALAIAGDELRAAADAQSELVPLLHPWKGSSDALTARIHAERRARLSAPDRQERVMPNVLLDAAGRRRSPATMPGFHSGRPPRNKGRRYPADPPTVEEIIAVMRQAGTTPHGLRMRGLIVVLWRAGLRIHEALALTEADLDARRGAVLVRRGKGGRRREVGMDDWAWEQLHQWLTVRVQRPVGPLFCILTGPTRGRAWTQAAAREQLRRTAALAGVRRRFVPHQLRHAHAVEMAREGVPLIVIQRQLGHTNLGITSIYLQGIDSAEIIDTVHARRAPVVPVNITLRP
jgi:integrase